MINHAKKVKSQDKYDHVVLRYPNRKLYLTEAGLYIAHAQLIEYIKKNESFVVYEDQTGNDITDDILRSVLAGLVKTDVVPIDNVVDLLIKYVVSSDVKVEV